MAIQSLPALEHLDQPMDVGWSLETVHGLGKATVWRGATPSSLWSNEYFSTEVGSKWSPTASTP